MKVPASKLYSLRGLADMIAVLGISITASAAEVYSSNTVGYSKITIPANGYTLVANPFVEVGTGDVIAINDMFAEDATVGTAGSSDTTADTLLTWDGSGYVTYYLRADASNGNHWRKSGERKATTDSVPEGDGAFYHGIGAEAATLTVSGEVRAEDLPVTILPGYNLLGNPFPTELSFATFVVEGAVAGTSDTNADTILTWDGTGYVTYYLRADSANGNHWRKSGERKATTDTIAPYTGFFYHSLAQSGSLAVTIPAPVTTTTAGE